MLFILVDADTILLLDSIEDCLQHDTNDVCDFLLKMVDSLPQCVSLLRKHAHSIYSDFLRL